MPTAYRLCFMVASVTTVLLLSACQPKSEDTEPTATAEPISAPVEIVRTTDTEDNEPDISDSDDEPKQSIIEADRSDGQNAR